MPVPLAEALDKVRNLVEDDEQLIRAVAAGRRKGHQPAWRRAELRYVDLKAGRHLQITRYDDTQAHVSNHPAGALDDALGALLAEPFGNWHVETATETLQVRVTKSGEAAISVQAGPGSVPDRAHDRAKQRLLPEDSPVLRALGISDAQGRVKPSRQAKYRQVEEFLRELAATVEDALASGRIAPTADRPLQVVDLGCGNAYLTFAAHAWLAGERGLPVRVVGVDVKQQSRDHNTQVATELGIEDEVSFEVGGIADVELATAPDVVLALHACDTATDDALARGIGWDAALILAAPCCHQDISRQLRDNPPPVPYSGLTRDGILRERTADTLTDALRAALLRSRGYRVEVVEFVDSAHTPRNTLLRAARTGAAADDAEYDELASAWGVHPKLAELLG
ncbi:class I SAM-dependent methyltransferase [Nocardioides marmorisolisilvae]|uniref:SAM-dependent methyltransferase n=1 Tax=Nocardioides marmorisolisilvae TaxID=1542737 RepID=A0A3N0DPC9_9ACTN|nr:SAM-dependent methyltransferase [Nocardioides marmorisolisilvae]RNL77316.1 SAM-dependent methyltransferase [Nocardioides marmorisolisilvae]